MSRYREPTWGTTEEAIDVETSPEKRSISPFEITGVITRLLQYHFSDPNNIENTLLKNYTWSTPRKDSRLLIGPEYLRNDAVLKRPALFVHREPVQATSLGEYRKIEVVVEGVTKNTPNYLRHLVGKHVVYCEAMAGAEAEALAWEVFNRMMVFSPTMTDDFNMDAFDVAGLGKVEQRVEQETSIFVVPVTLTWQKTHIWSILSPTVY